MIFWCSCRDTLRGLWLPLLGTVLAGTVTARILGQTYCGSWLHLPGLLLAAASLATALDSWPLFSRARPGHSWLQRLTDRATHGCVAAALGTWTGLAAALASAGVLFALILSLCDAAPEPLSRRVSFTTTAAGATILSSAQPMLSFDATHNTPVARLMIRPTPVMVRGHGGAVGLRVFADDQALHQGMLSNLGDTIELRLVPPRPIHRLELRCEPNTTGVLFLPPRNISAYGATAIPTWVNGGLAGMSYLLPAALALAVMVLGHRRLALPVNLGAGLAVLVVTTIADLAPPARAITAFSRGQWLGQEGLGASTLSCLGVAASILVLAVVVGRMDRS